LKRNAQKFVYKLIFKDKTFSKHAYNWGVYMSFVFVVNFGLKPHTNKNYDVWSKGN